MRGRKHGKRRSPPRPAAGPPRSGLLRHVVAALTFGLLPLGLAGGGAAQAPDSDPALTGVVVASETGDPVAGARVRIVGMDREGVSGPDGRFRIPDLAPGTYTLRVTALGWSATRLPGVAVPSPEGGPTRVELARRPLGLEGVEVRTSRRTARLREVEPTPGMAMAAEELRSLPHPGEDVFRALRLLPGVAASEFSSRLHVRGGRADALRVRLDGLELLDPFHLREAGGLLSTVDEAALASADLRTGALPARDPTGGSTLELRTRGPELAEPHTAVGLSASLARALSAGPLDGGDGSWLVSARYGFLDLVMSARDQPFTAVPRYHDGLAKLEWRPGPGHHLSAHVLRTGDRSRYRSDDVRFVGRRDDTYGWTSWTWEPGSRLRARTTVSAGALHRRREGESLAGDDGTVWQTISGARSLEMVGGEQDWTLQAADALRLSWGAEVRAQRASFDYSRRNEGAEGFEEGPEADVATSREGVALGGYVSGRLDVARPLTLEAGVRYDLRTYSDQRQLSPRLAGELRLGGATTLRAGWGVYWQPQRIHELPVERGRLDYHPAQIARQISVGLEHTAAGAVRVGVEGYRRRVERPIPYHLNLDQELALLPETSRDRVLVQPERGEARGVEVWLSGAGGGRWGWGLSYALSRAEDRWRDRTLLEPWDQTHAFKAHLAWRPTEDWTLSLTDTYHTGWPTTDPAVVQDLLDGEIPPAAAADAAHAERVRDYHRGDLRLERAFDVGGGSLRIHLDVVNFYNRHNVRSLRLRRVPGAEGGGRREVETSYFPRLVVGGIRFEM